MKQRYDILFEALSHEQRRQILFSLVEQDESVNIDSPPDNERMHIERRHVHLPKLEEYGFIDWTPQINAIERGPRFGEVEPVLRLLADNHEAFSATSV
ncbi:hypothetical protein SAMN04489842_3932 [Natronobacterium texcoconense]|uniref:ArsR family transcriptional regulator n=1 Tax=Natronobacterium texcoconense TaxID=1095778 RepID=A0A1H1IYK8_NATTX|nr:hypothetical protein SAMN04489842_3932 [Natronobacterium texcoconense]